MCRLTFNARILCFSEFRDQGLTRPKVLIVVPFRESARRIVDMMIQLLNPSDQVVLTCVLLDT